LGYEKQIFYFGSALLGKFLFNPKSDYSSTFKTGAAQTSHYGVTEGNETAEIVVFYAGVVGTPLSIHAEE